MRRISGCSRFRAASRPFLGALVAVLFAALPAGESPAKDPIVTGVRLGVNSGATRVVLDLDRKVQYSAFLLADPYRLVIDLPEVSWGVNGETTTRKGVVTNLRYGLFRPGNSRVVVDLKSPVKIVAHGSLTAPNRVMFDLAPVRKAVFKSGGKVGNLRPPVGKTPIKPVPKPSGDTRRVIVIDAGHGGVDPGAIRGRIYEKRITLAVAKAVKTTLEATGRYRVVLTRRRDMFLELRQRAAVARANKADFFISFHADTTRKTATRGASVYTLSEKASDAETAELVAKENRVDAIAGLDINLEGYSGVVPDILLDLRFRETMNESSDFTNRLLAHFRKQKVRVINRKPHRSAGFVVLKSPAVPSVLVELGYLSNRYDRKLLVTGKFHRKVGRAVVGALDEYFKRRDKLRAAQ